MRIETVPISRINYLNLRNLILDKGLTMEDTIVLSTENFDDLILEYREIYKESMPIPHILLGVLIREAENEFVPLQSVIIIKDDTKSIRYLEAEDDFNYYEGEIFYRCGYCGNVVNNLGLVLEGQERKRAINYHENYQYKIVKHVDGKCCRP
ncbi:hypothetical protein [Sphingobacterium composti Ten et al. 2007 non Yoo et al. 2007]|uniref:hypothetical protein n=1 Tax=Sphingobacterium composti TaxID=363260 RepID=UPI0013572687|nr:hypothetical protein [Sphingobacterium composti Ten et al. 2007 non Yoo et al. 2007]